MDFREYEKKFTIVRNKIESLVYTIAGELSMEGYKSKEPKRFEERFEGEAFKPKIGETWGGLFDCAWFHFTGKVPAEAVNQKCVMLIDFSGEGLVYTKEGEILQGLTSATSRDEFPLGLWGKKTVEISERADGNEIIDIWVDAGCNDIEGQYRNDGRVKEAYIAIVDTAARDLFYDWVVCQSLYVGLCENNDPYSDEVREFIEKAAEVLSVLTDEGIDCRGNEGIESGKNDSIRYNINDNEEYRKNDSIGYKTNDSIGDKANDSREYRKSDGIISESINKARQILSGILEKENNDKSLTYSSIGHSHLDLLFLWPLRETIRKGARTYSTVLKMMDLYEDYKFGCSQAPIYMWMKQHYPKLYEKIKEKIKEKRWEVQGSFYIECDTNIPCGESLVRQLLYGKRFFENEFNLTMQVGFLPDVFGYSAVLPQLLIKSGTPYFMTNKLSMNDTNRFPMHTFWWQGIDGSKVLTHMLPEDSYNSAFVPQMAIYGLHHYTDKDKCSDALQLYGLGDGGGGPGYEHFERKRRMKNLKGCPTHRDEFVVDFFHRIEKNKENYRTWQGELYFERHQGTYTSIAKSKKYNRKIEWSLHTLEWLSVMAEVKTGLEYPMEAIRKLWEEVLLYQFHDCLPGSSIKRVYDESHAGYERMQQEIKELADKAYEALARIAAKGYDREAVCFNSVSMTREAYINAYGKEKLVKLKPYSICSCTMSDAADAFEEYSDISLKSIDDVVHVLENDYIKVLFTSKGTISSLINKKTGLSMLKENDEGNQLLLYKDELTHWDINKDYLKEKPVKAEIITMSAFKEAHAAGLKMEYKIGRSYIKQRIILRDNSARLDFQTEVDWQEEYQMLRVSFPTSVIADQAACDIQFGYVKRPTHTNTSWDEAKFEVCAHKWVDLSDDGSGIAMLNDCKYGYKVWNNVLDMCLLRSQNCPCEEGDKGMHSFTYSIYPHNGDIFSGGVIREGYLLNEPVSVITKLNELSNSTHEDIELFYSDAENVLIETVKKAEDGNGYIVRLYEAAGRRTKVHLGFYDFVIKAVCDLLEQPQTLHDKNEICLEFSPFEIQTLLLEYIY